MTNIGENVEKLETSHIAGRFLNGAATLHKSLAATQNVKYKVTMWLGNSTPRHIPKRNENIYSHACTEMFMAALVITAKK